MGRMKIFIKLAGNFITWLCVVVISAWDRVQGCCSRRMVKPKPGRVQLGIETSNWIIDNTEAMADTPQPSATPVLFRLIRTQPHCHFPPIHADFTPLRGPHQTATSLVPKFNRDALHFTPSFVNPYDLAASKLTSEQACARERQHFMQKVQGQDQQEHSTGHSLGEASIEFDPRDEHNCSICSTDFDCYWEHVNSPAHLRRLRAARASQYLHELCQHVQASTPLPEISYVSGPKPPGKTKIIAKKVNRSRPSNQTPRRTQAPPKGQETKVTSEICAADLMISTQCNLSSNMAGLEETLIEI